MEADRKVKLKSYAWLAALAMLLALFVPLASAGAQTEDPDGEQLSAQAVAEEGGTLDATPESDTNMVDETHTVHAGIDDGDADDAVDDDFTIRAEVAEDDIDDASYDGGLPATAAKECQTDDPGADHGDHCEVTFNEDGDTAPTPGKDRIRVYHDENDNDQWDSEEDYDFVTKTWVSAAEEADAERLGGDDRIETAVEISKDHWADAGAATDQREDAQHVVIARADDFPDALAGTPFAVKVEAPLLLTYREVLEDATEAELQRVLNADDDDDTIEVYILGEFDAISQNVENEIEDLGYTVKRLGGDDRFDTAIEIAKEIESMQDSLDHIFIARSHVFPDALAGGAAAAHVAEGEDVGAIVLAPDGFKESDTDEFVEARDDTATTYALAGPLYNPYACSTEDPELTKVNCADEEDADWTIYGWDRHETARAIGEFFFDGPTEVGVARSDLFPDALTGGAHIGQFNGPIVLTPTADLHPEAERYLCYTADTIEHGFVYGEEQAVDNDTFAEVDAAIDGADCPPFDTPGNVVSEGS